MALAIHPRRHPQGRPRERTRPGPPLQAASSSNSSPRRKPSGASPSTAYRSLANTALDHLSVPDQVLADDNRYITITGCVVHFCPARGMLWVDLDGIPQRSPRRLRRPRLDQPESPHLRPRRRIHALGSSPASHSPSPARRASARSADQSDRPLDRPAARRQRHRPEHHPRHPRRPRRHAPRGPPRSPRHPTASSSIRHRH